MKVRKVETCGISQYVTHFALPIIARLDAYAVLPDVRMRMRVALMLRLAAAVLHLFMRAACPTNPSAGLPRQLGFLKASTVSRLGLNDLTLLGSSRFSFLIRLSDSIRIFIYDEFRIWRRRLPCCP